MSAKRLIFIGFVIVSIIVIQGLVSSIYDLWHKQDLIKAGNQSLSKNLEENKELKAKLKEVQTQSFIEQEARNKLFMALPGEEEIILPTPTPDISKKGKIELPNWKKWVQLLIPGVFN